MAYNASFDMNEEEVGGEKRDRENNNEVEKQNNRAADAVYASGTNKKSFSGKSSFYPQGGY